MKKFWGVFLIAASLAMSGCSASPAESPADLTKSGETSLMIPYVIGADEAAAKKALDSIGIAVTVEYGYAEGVENGIVYDADPAVGESVKAGDEVTLYVRDFFEASSATLGWWSLDTTDSYAGSDKWEFYAPYIIGDYLVIDFCDVTFSEDVTWANPLDGSNTGYGRASLSYSFVGGGSLTLYYETQSNSKGTPQNFKVVVPLNSFVTDRPKDLYMWAYFWDNDGSFREVKFALYDMEW